jgi:hypothetical protein
MYRASPLRIPTSAQRWMAAFLVMVLVVCAWTSTLARIQGASHFHRPQAIVSPNLSASAINTSALFGHGFKPPSRSIFVHSQQAQPAHAHDDLERHHHDATDASVVSLDAILPFDAARAELDASAAKAGMLLSQPSLLWPSATMAALDAARTPWCETPLWALKTSELPGPRRPPKLAA